MKNGPGSIEPAPVSGMHVCKAQGGSPEHGPAPAGTKMPVMSIEPDGRGTIRLCSRCANGLKAGPYNLQRVRYATQVVTGGNKFCGQSSASTSQSCSSNSDSLSDGGIAGIAVATFVFGAAIAAIATIYVLRGKNAFNPSPRMEMSTSNPMSSA